MTAVRTLKFFALTSCLCFLFSPLNVLAEDIDIFTAPAGTGLATAANVMIIIDNSTSDLYSAKVNAVKEVLTSIGGVNLGLALWVTGGNPKGVYVRLGVKSMANAGNLKAYQDTLTAIDNNAALSGQNDKEEVEAYYEIFKYYSGLKPYAGKTTVPNVDPTAFLPNGSYNPPDVPICSNDYIIYIAANNGYDVTMVTGKQTYETPPGSVGPKLPSSAGASTASWADEWTHYLYANKNPQIISYVIDVATPGNLDAAYRALLQDEARQGGGKWIPATDKASIKNALLKIFGEIQAVNSTFASVSLPVNTTNRAQDRNQVFIPQFRPDAGGKPRWVGNLKQYQLIANGTAIDLGDSLGNEAINTSTGFLTDCAISFWTTDSLNYSGTDAYWKNVFANKSAVSGCLLAGVDAYSDKPDGPAVEKGGVAEVIRKGNDRPTATPTWKVNRTVWTQPLAGGVLAAFSASSPGLDTATGLSTTTIPKLADLVNFTIGQDVNLDEMAGRTDATLTRPSLHGDAVHSRPLPVDYEAKGVTVYYGSNDGFLRAVDSQTGQERWSFVAPEFYSKLKRLKDNSPLIKYPAISDLTATPKDYFFDGSFGVFQNQDPDPAMRKVWIYPSMRRGGRVIYALDASDPAVPKFKWKVGCPNATNDTGCTTGFTGIGQTWSVPSVTSSLLGYKDSAGKYKPVLIVGGGYDTCEDADVVSPTCTSPKGTGVYVIDADTGALIKSFATLRSVAADVSLLGLGTAGVVDHAYAADTAGNLYRIDFDADQTKWAINRIASTKSGDGRKFLFEPSLLPVAGNQVYVGIGSGDREHPLKANAANGVQNRFYMYRDDLTKTAAIGLDDTSSTGVMCDFSLNTTCSPGGIPPGSSKRGWYINLPGSGEQTVTSSLIVGGVVTFSTNMPTPPSAVPKAICTPDLGVATGYMLNLLTASGAIGVSGISGGDRSGTFIGGGLPPSPVFATVPVGNKATSVVIGAIQKSGSASSPIASQIVNPAISPNRKSIYWKSSGEN